jgi:Zn-finger nucleic acid-binding protein
MKCPECNVDLLMGERLTVQIDYCPKCRGTWLEKGKLEQLLGSSTGSNADNQTKNDRKNDRRREDNDDERGVGGFLRGIFD